MPDAERLRFEADMPDGPARVAEINRLLDRLRTATA